MKRIFLFCLTLTVTSLYAQVSTQPAQPSVPLPSLQKTQNKDTVLTEKVQAEIARVSILQGQSVSAASHEGIITLEGSVDTQLQHDAAINAAKKVNGVKEVKSELTIKLLSKENKIN